MRAQALQPQHPLQAPGADRPPRRSLRAQARDPAEGAAHRRLCARREGADGLLLRWPPRRLQRGRSGSTPRSTSPPPTPGPSCAKASTTPPPATPPSWSTWSPRTSRRRAGSSVRSPPTTARSSAPSTSAALAEHKATQRKIKAGRPNSNGCAERVQLTILEECWRPAFSRSLAPTDHRPAARPRRVPALLQHRSCPHGPADEGQGAGGYRLRRPQDGERAMRLNCRHISGIGRASGRSVPSPHSRFRPPG